MKISGEITVYAVADSHNNTWIGAVNDESDTIQVYGMKDAANEPLYFESDAYHIPTWCIYNGLRMSVTKQEITAEIAV